MNQLPQPNLLPRHPTLVFVPLLTTKPPIIIFKPRPHTCPRHALPFQARASNHRPPPVVHRRPGPPDDLDPRFHRLLLQCFERDVARRPSSADLARLPIMRRGAGGPPPIPHFHAAVPHKSGWVVDC